MNPYEMVVLIVLLVTIGRVLGGRRRRRDFRDLPSNRQDDLPAPETARLKEEVAHLKQRIQVLERIAVDKENSLTREIEQLRDH